MARDRCSVCLKRRTADVAQCTEQHALAKAAQTWRLNGHDLWAAAIADEHNDATAAALCMRCGGWALGSRMAGIKLAPPCASSTAAGTQAIARFKAGLYPTGGDKFRRLTVEALAPWPG